MSLKNKIICIAKIMLEHLELDASAPRIRSTAKRKLKVANKTRSWKNIDTKKCIREFLVKIVIGYTGL